MNNKSRKEICQGRNIRFLQALQHDYSLAGHYQHKDSSESSPEPLFIYCSTEGEIESSLMGLLC